MAGIFQIFFIRFAAAAALALDISEQKRRVYGLIDIAAVVDLDKRLGDEILISRDKHYLDSRAYRAYEAGDIHAALVLDGDIDKGEVKAFVGVLLRKPFGQLGGAVYADKLYIRICAFDYFR